jgi:hypothetical protein
VFAIAASCFVAFPSLSPQVGTSAPVLGAKGDRADIRPLDLRCVGLAVFRRRVRPRWTYPARPAARRAQPLVASVYGIGKLLIDGMPAILRACHLPPNIQFAHDATFAGQWRRGRAMSKLSAILRHSGLPRVLSCWRRWGFAGGHFPLPRKTPVPRARSGSSCHFRRAARPMSWGG